MSTNHLNSNDDLFHYLCQIGRDLKTRGATEPGEAAEFASRQAAGMSTEFLGEARIALLRILNEGEEVLDLSEREDFKAVPGQLASALDRGRN